MLRLPQKPQSNPVATGSSSPTLDKLLQSGPYSEQQDASAQAISKSQQTASLPSNLRIEQYVPRRKDYAGVKASHRQLLHRLRREA
ncbi:hypothetical protein OIO90_004680 [Microbotryomycetes sp. JL221]|nr:hypothetical protein OIO90_004680 [Microbotryomycetes sp. JL221]